ncbi:MAG: ribosomal L7Ae/L30e/S12e/Gadd45 family protein [Thermoproteota archaeon]
MLRVITADYEPSEQLVKMAEDTLKLASQTGKTKKGVNEVTKAVERGLAKVVFIADNVEPVEIILHLPLLCRDRKVSYIVVPDKKVLGSLVGLEVPTSAVAIVDPGQAQSQVEELRNKIEQARVTLKVAR